MKCDTGEAECDPSDSRNKMLTGSVGSPLSLAGLPAWKKPCLYTLVLVKTYNLKFSSLSSYLVVILQSGASGVHISFSLLFYTSRSLCCFHRSVHPPPSCHSFLVFSFIHPIFPHPSELNLFNYSRFLLPIHIAARSQTHTSSLKPLAVFVTVFISWRRLISLVWLAFSLGFEKYWYSIDANKWLVGVRGLHLFISSSIWYFIDVSQWKNKLKKKN